MKDGEKYIHNKSEVEFTLVQETPVAWSLRNEKFFNPNDYPIYPEYHMKDLLEKNFKKVENNE